MEIIVTSKNISYDSNTGIAHFGAHFNSQAQVLSFNIDIMDPPRKDEAFTEFETFKTEVMQLIDPDIIYPEPMPEEDEEEINPVEENIDNNGEETEEGGNE